MLYQQEPMNVTPLRQAIIDAYHLDEDKALAALLPQANLSLEAERRIFEEASSLVEKVRATSVDQGGVDAILKKYDLSSEEGIALMCVAEALLRIPDAETVDKLLQDKLSSADWSVHLGKSDSFFVNMVTWSLMVTGKLYSPVSETSVMNTLKRLTKSSSAIAIRPAVKKFMEFLGKKFVMGETIEEALKRAKNTGEKMGYRYSYDMLGEAARTDQDALKYLKAYQQALQKIGEYAENKGPIASPGISIKLSALHPRYEFAKKASLLEVLVPRVKALVLQAKEYNIGLTIDAEEADRLDIELDIIEAVFSDPALGEWQGFGVAVQSYQKRAPFVLDFLADLSRRHRRRMMIRLIKGAYWDYEIKFAQIEGLSQYPVFTRKHSTDVSYIACAKKLISYADWLYPQFATHNAFSIATILELVGDHPFEFQCLHGMGQKLYDHIVGEENKNLPCRVYAPVGTHEELLGYLMRRLLENGANTSFVNLIANPDTPIETLLQNPIRRIDALASKAHPRIPLPRNLFGEERRNSQGLDLTDMNILRPLKKAMDVADAKSYHATYKIHGETAQGAAEPILSPIDKRPLGTVTKATTALVEAAYQHAMQARDRWDATPVTVRAECLRKAADLLEEHMPTLMTLAIREAGKTPANAVGEVREAVDFLRYYAQLAETSLVPQILKGPTGESNQLHCHGRGIIVCISPWNFPLAIFLGQVAAALVAGNCVLAKPSEQTPLIAGYAVDLLYQAGIPTDVLQYLPGAGSTIGSAMVADARLAGVMFTGSTETANRINRTLADRKGPIVPFVAETGGQNVMIVDSSALPEQVVADVMRSAFDSAGQRCSALRVLYLQEEIAEKIITMLIGAMKTLVLGDPSLLATDVGPVIDEAAKKMLLTHIDRMKQQATLLYEVPINPALTGYFVGPCAFELKDLSLLTGEVFGPVLHVIRYKKKHIDAVMESINATGFGLTLGVHSRLTHFAEFVQSKTRVGNTYVNRNMIGAVVGVQPFGGEGLSGTGPKAGGPHYLFRLCAERTVSINTSAAGGNASLLMLSE